ncbi:hypothetical protein FSST1_012729 [Fusarium sambucinum]
MYSLSNPTLLQLNKMPPFFDYPRLNATLPLNATTVVSYLVKKHLKVPKSKWSSARKAKAKKWTGEGIFIVVAAVVLGIALLIMCLLWLCRNFEGQRREYHPPPTFTRISPPPLSPLIKPTPRKPEPKHRPRNPPRAKPQQKKEEPQDYFRWLHEERQKRIRAAIAEQEQQLKKPLKAKEQQPKKPLKAKKKPAAPKIQEIPPFKAPPRYTRISKSDP